MAEIKSENSSSDASDGEEEKIEPTQPCITFVSDKKISTGFQVKKMQTQRKSSRLCALPVSDTDTNSNEDSAKSNSSDVESDETKSDGEDASDDEKEPIVKARVLGNDDALGQTIFGFKTPKRKEALAKAAKDSVHSAKRPQQRKTPGNLSKKDNQSTPHDTKKYSKRNATARIYAISSARNMVEGSGSESEDSEEDREEEDDQGSEEDDTTEERVKLKEPQDLLDEYFEAHHKKVVTSDTTLSKLKNPKMAQEELQLHLKDIQSTHINETIKLHNKHTVLFDKWMFQILSGFNVLLYGLGSKHSLLEQFRKRILSNIVHLVINGFFPSISIKQILNTITEDLLERNTSFKNIIDHYSYIKKEFDSDHSGKLFLVVHNIDGQMMRSQNMQSALSNLASSKNIHVIASIDHINASLIWDQNRASAFNWLWYDCTTYEPYAEETSYENSLMVHQSGTLALSSLSHVLRSLTPNARGIFNLLVQYQLDNEDNTSYSGLSFAELYAKCRERFLVNSDLTLRAQLTEFKDHKLVKTKKGLDGVEYLSVGLDCATLKQFVENEKN